MKIKYLVLLFSLLWTTTSFAQNVECFILKAPEKPFYNIKKIGVLDLKVSPNYRMSSVMTNYVIGDLIKQYRGVYQLKDKMFGLQKGEAGQTFVRGVKTDFYKIIERDQLEKILKEQRISLSGIVDENSAAEVGKILGLDVIIMGEVSYNTVDERTTSWLGLASSSNNNCNKRTVTASGNIKLVSVETAQIIGTKNASSKLSVQKCDDQRSTMPNQNDMADICLKDLSKKFVDYFAPGYQYIEYEFEKIQLKEFKKKSKEALELIEKGEIDKAFPTVYAMFEADSYNPKAAYNLGVLYEMVGDYENALEYFRIASDLDFNNEKFIKARKRAEEGVGLVNYLADIGRPVESYTFNGDELETALADKIQIKGNQSDRVNVYQIADKKSKVIAKVPGGLEFKVVEKSADFYLVQLRGSQTGFIHKSDVK